MLMHFNFALVVFGVSERNRCVFELISSASCGVDTIVAGPL